MIDAGEKNMIYLLIIAAILLFMALLLLKAADKKIECLEEEKTVMLALTVLAVELKNREIKKLKGD